MNSYAFPPIQTYAHKILTGRRSLMHTIMQKNGISGFTSRRESEYDAFGAGHGCNSISAGLGTSLIQTLSLSLSLKVDANTLNFFKR